MDKFRVLQETCQELVGQRIAVLAARYQYRGILAESHTDHLIIAQAVMVEVSGAAMGERAPNEDPIGSSIIIPYGAVEMIWQPNWVNGPLPSQQ